MELRFGIHDSGVDCFGGSKARVLCSVAATHMKQLIIQLTEVGKLWISPSACDINTLFQNAAIQKSETSRRSKFFILSGPWPTCHPSPRRRSDAAPAHAGASPAWSNYPMIETHCTAPQASRAAALSRVWSGRGPRYFRAMLPPRPWHLRA
jgi:hypothetical protein